MTTRRMFIAATCIALNLTLAKVANLLALPVYIDSTGTILAAALLPPLVAIAVGICTSLLGAVVISPFWAAYAGTQVAIALIAVMCIRLGLFQRWWSAILAGFVIAITAAIVSAPVTVIVFGGVTVSGTTAINAILMASGRSVWQSVIGGSLLIESIDKPAASLLAWLALRQLPASVVSPENVRAEAT